MVGIGAACGDGSEHERPLREVTPPTATELEVARLMGEARRLIESGDSAGAETLLRRVVTLQPHSGEEHFLLGRALHELRRTEEARAALEEAIRSDPRLFDARRLLARTYEDAQDFESAAKVYRAWTVYAPNDDDAWFAYGKALHELGDLEGARDAFKRAIRNRAGRSDARSELGLVLHELGSLPAAEERLKEAVGREPESVTAWARLGAVLEDAGPERRAEAIEAYTRALALGDTRASTRARVFRLERLRARGADADAAAQAAVHAAELLEQMIASGAAEQLPWHGLPARPHLPKDPLAEERRLNARLVTAPDDLSARIELAALLQAQGLLDEAVPAYRAALERAPADRARELGARLGGALLAAGNGDEAEPLLVGAPEGDAVALRQLAWLYLSAGRPAEAEAAYDRVLAADPADVRAERGRALALLALGRLDEGVAVFTAPPRRK